MYDESYFTLFYDIKSRTFDIYSCQFAFIIFISSQIAFFDRIMRNAPFMNKKVFLRTLVNFMRNLLSDLSDYKCTSGEIFFYVFNKNVFFWLISKIYTTMCIMIINYFVTSHVEFSLVRSFRFISPKKPKISTRTIHHFSWVDKAL